MSTFIYKCIHTFICSKFLVIFYKINTFGLFLKKYKNIDIYTYTNVCIYVYIIAFADLVMDCDVKSFFSFFSLLLLFLLLRIN